MNLQLWLLLGLFWSVILVLELAVVLFWVRGRARVLAAASLGLLLVNHLVVPQLTANRDVQALVSEALSVAALVLLGLAVIRARPRPEGSALRQPRPARPKEEDWRYR